MSASERKDESLVRAIEARDAEEVSLLSAQLGYVRPPEAIREWIDRLAAAQEDKQAAFVATMDGAVVGWIAWAWERSVQTVRVSSRSTRADAHRFYLRDGYRELKTSLVFEKSRTCKAPLAGTCGD
jgi:hypothetical protein